MAANVTSVFRTEEIISFIFFFNAKKIEELIFLHFMTIFYKKKIILFAKKFDILSTSCHYDNKNNYHGSHTFSLFISYRML
jgi:hypothetical protein